MPDEAIIIEIPVHLAEAAQATSDELKTELAIHLYNEQRFSLEQAGELAGMSLETFRQLLYSRNISPNKHVLTVDQAEREIAKRLRELDEDYFDLLTSLSFEMRTPFTAILGFSTLLLDYNKDEPLTTNQRKWVTHYDDAWVTTTITNTGAGISDSTLEALALDPPIFWRTISTDWELYASQYLIKKHDGTMNIENIEGGGASVTFTLPVHPADS